MNLLNVSSLTVDILEYALNRNSHRTRYSRKIELSGIPLKPHILRMHSARSLYIRWNNNRFNRVK